MGLYEEERGKGVSKCIEGGLCAPSLPRSLTLFPTLSLAGSDAWEELGCTSPLYLPTERDVGSMLRVEVTPGRYSDAAPAAVTVGGRPVLRGEVVLAETSEWRLQPPV